MGDARGGPRSVGARPGPGCSGLPWPARLACPADGQSDGKPGWACPQCPQASLRRPQGAEGRGYGGRAAGGALRDAPTSHDPRRKLEWAGPIDDRGAPCCRNGEQLLTGVGRCGRDGGSGGGEQPLEGTAGLLRFAPQNTWGAFGGRDWGRESFPGREENQKAALPRRVAREGKWGGRDVEQTCSGCRRWVEDPRGLLGPCDSGKCPLVECRCTKQGMGAMV